MKSWMIFIFGLLFAGLIIATIYYSLAPNPGHLGDKISINIKGQNITLQEGIDSRILLGYNLNGVFINDFLNDNSHSGDQISIIVSGYEKTIQEAINSGTLCSNSSSSSNSVYPNPGHLGNQTLVKNLSGYEKTIQEMINDEEFCTCGDGICQNSSNLNNYGENAVNCVNDCNVGNIMWGEERRYWKTNADSTYRLCGADAICNLTPTWGPINFMAPEVVTGLNYSFYWNNPPGSGNYFLQCFIMNDSSTPYNTQYSGWCPKFDACPLPSLSYISNMPDNIHNVNFVFTKPKVGNYQTLCAEHQYNSGSKGSGSYQGYSFVRVRRFSVLS